MTNPEARSFLVADIGGTNTRVALSHGDQLQRDTIRRYRNDAFDGFDPILRDFLSRNESLTPAAICVAVAGPVRDGYGELTNRNWTFSEAHIASMTGAPHVALLNDLQAQGYALEHIAPQDMITIREGAPAPAGAAKLAVNLGTGFNASPVFETPSGPFVATSESGHAMMPVRAPRDLALCHFVEERHGFAAIDDILTGRGLQTVYAFVTEEAGQPNVATSAEIIAGCRDGDHPLAVEAVHYFIRLTALVMGNLALMHLPFGGLYLVGGLSSAIAPFMARAGFEEAFRDKGRFAEFMDDFGVRVVQDDYAALKGVAVYLAARMGR